MAAIHCKAGSGAAQARLDRRVVGSSVLSTHGHTNGGIAHPTPRNTHVRRQLAGLARGDLSDGEAGPPFRICRTPFLGVPRVVLDKHARRGALGLPVAAGGVIAAGDYDIVLLYIYGHQVHVRATID